MEKRWWNDRKIEWYERASLFSDFHTLLSREIESLINKDESILEFGSGLGYVSEILAKDGYNISSYDIDEMVIERAKERSSLDIYHTADYRDLEIRGDVVLTIFFGRLWSDDNLSSLLSHANKRLVSIHSLHTGQNNAIKGRKTPGLEESLSFLRDNGFEANGKEITIPFPQPLLSMEEAELFIKESYPEKDVSLYLPYVKKTYDKTYPYMLSNKKRMVILSIDK